jgi:cyclophilin family peptidyl-prolyl cis-trans isomerase
VLRKVCQFSVRLGKVPQLTTHHSFLKLCKVKYYNFSPVHSVQKNFSFQTGDPIGPESQDSDGGSSIWGLLSGPTKKTFVVEIDPKVKHVEMGTVSMATVPSAKDPDERLVGSQFLITLGENLDFLDGKAAIFGKVVEGFDTLEKINRSFVDAKGRPLKDIRIRHTPVLDDPFDDPPGLIEPEKSPLPSKAQLATVMIGDDEELDQNIDEATLEKLRREREARAQALTLEMVGDLPFAEVKPPENVLFVCKLNPVTQDEDLNLIFSRFGKILSCEVIRDKRTGDSLQWTFHRVFQSYLTPGVTRQIRRELGNRVVSEAFPAWRRRGNTAGHKKGEGRPATVWSSIKTTYDTPDAVMSLPMQGQDLEAAARGARIEIYKICVAGMTTSQNEDMKEVPEEIGTTTRSAIGKYWEGGRNSIA